MIQLAPAEEHEREQRLEAARAALGSEFAAAWHAGESMAKDEAIQFALAEAAPRTAEYRIPAAPVAPAGAAKGGLVTAEAAASGPALRVLALGPLQVFRDGVAIDPATWGSARPRELLLFLLMQPGGCTKEQVGVAFWPEASSAQLRNSFHVTLHRLRKALAHPEWIGVSNDRYQLDPSVVCELDATLFEQETTGALRALKRGGEESAVALERALERYRGDFLDGEPAGDWHLTHRDHLQRLYLDGTLALGSWLLKGDRFARAAESFRRILARDELHEEGWRQLMLCHARMGERSQALRLYQRLSDLLRRELETEPDAETTALYQRLQRGQAV
jgi:DNA-binding SARP family transcriptional activator